MSTEERFEIVGLAGGQVLSLQSMPEYASVMAEITTPLGSMSAFIDDREAHQLARWIIRAIPGGSVGYRGFDDLAVGGVFTLDDGRPRVKLSDTTYVIVDNGMRVDVAGAKVDWSQMRILSEGYSL